MVKTIKQKHNNNELACKQVRYAFTNILHIYSMEYKICTDKLCAVAAAHFVIAKWSVHVCHYKGFTCSKYKHSGEHKHNNV